MKLQVTENGGGLATLLDYVLESERENFAEHLVENRPDGMTDDEFAILEDGHQTEAERPILERFAATVMDHAWAIAFRQRAVLARGRVIDFTYLLEARRALKKYCADNEGKEGSYDYDAAQGSYLDDVAQAADGVVDDLTEFLETLKGDPATDGQTESEESKEESPVETP
jgi:hypothetical protein